MEIKYNIGYPFGSLTALCIFAIPGVIAPFVYHAIILTFHGESVNVQLTQNFSIFLMLYAHFSLTCQEFI